VNARACGLATPNLPAWRGCCSAPQRSSVAVLTRRTPPRRVAQDGRASLHLAAYQGHLELVKLLLSKGANVTATTAVRPRVSSPLPRCQRRREPHLCARPAVWPKPTRARCASLARRAHAARAGACADRNALRRRIGLRCTLRPTRATWRLSSCCSRRVPTRARRARFARRRRRFSAAKGPDAPRACAARAHRAACGVREGAP
jgi:hypothetical protein